MYKREYFLMGGALLMIAASGAVGYWVGKDVSPTPITVYQETTKQNNEQNVENEPAPVILDEPDTLPLKENSLPKDLATKISWQDAKLLPTPEILPGAKPRSYYIDMEEQREGGLYLYSVGSIIAPELGDGFYEVGTFTYNNEKGSIILLKMSPEGIGAPVYYRMIQYQGSYTILSKYSDWFDPEKNTDFDPEKVFFDATISIPELDFPEKIHGPKTRQVLTRAEDGIFVRNRVPAHKEPVFRDAKLGQVYSATDTGAFYVKRPDGLDQTYVYEPDFSTEKITWDTVVVRTSSYLYTTPGGCGPLNFIAVKSDITIAKDLVKIGKNEYGDILYGLKDEKHQKLQYIYENLYNPAEAQKVSYEEFIASVPLFYWVDPFGRLIEFANQSYIPQAECGKPVIYLYPTKTTEVNVQVKPFELTYSDPLYKDGWKVVAEPTGRLTEVGTNRVYPYLYWEGEGKYYDMPTKGFVVKRSEIETFLPEKLKVLGLNKQETKDFMEFWLPRMLNKEKPYYFITFLGTRHMDELAPLTITPKPDTVVRILMDYKGLDAPIKVEPIKLPATPVRRGFTVIEWGGVLGR